MKDLVILCYGKITKGDKIMEKEMISSENSKLHQDSHPTFENSGSGVLGSIVFIILMLAIMVVISIYMK